MGWLTSRNTRRLPTHLGMNVMNSIMKKKIEGQTGKKLYEGMIKNKNGMEECNNIMGLIVSRKNTN